MGRKNNRDDPPKLAKYTVVVTCVLVKKSNDGQERALIMKRSPKEREGPGLWTIPGGRLRRRDWGRRVRVPDISHRVWVGVLTRAIKREIKEEAGIKVKRVQLVQGREQVFLRKDRTPTVVLVFRACVGPKTRVRIGKESTGLCWVTRQELSRYEFIGNVRSDILAVLCKK